MAIRSFVTPIIVGATVGTIWELLTKSEDSPRLLQDTGRKILAGAVTGVAYSVLRRCFGHSVAIPVILCGAIGSREVLKHNYNTGMEEYKRFLGVTLIGALIGFGLLSIPTPVWSGIANRMRFHVNLR
jgi:uncharacterized membrane protein YeaQ/YmgE (transglycosylase-associated protein family)